MKCFIISNNRLLGRIPAEKMKMRDPHIVPLSHQAITVLKELHPLTGGENLNAVSSIRWALTIAIIYRVALRI